MLALLNMVTNATCNSILNNENNTDRERESRSDLRQVGCVDMMTCRFPSLQSDFDLELDLDLVTYKPASEESLTYF